LKRQQNFFVFGSAEIIQNFSSLKVQPELNLYNFKLDKKSQRTARALRLVFVSFH